MTRFLYSLGIRLYIAGIHIASLFNSKAKLWVSGRKNCFEKNNEKAKQIRGCVWFHCASLGEFEMARPLIEKLKKEKPETKILLTFFSPSGYEIRKNYPLADLIIYIPADTKVNAYYFVEAFRPSIAIFVKYEIWLNILAELKKQNIKTLLISAVFQPEQRFFKWYGKIFRKALIDLDKIYVQDQNSHDLLKKWKISSVIAGDNRFDRVYETTLNVAGIREIEDWKGNDLLLIAGSSWEPEEELLARYLANNSNQKIIFAPHDISESHIAGLEKKLNNTAIRFSKIKSKPVEKIIVIDNIGMLASLYQYADIALVGGGFSGKLHNILEPAAFGIPVLFGPKHQRFQEASVFISSNAAYSFNDDESLKKILDKLINDLDFRLKAGESSKNIVRKNLGATELIWKENFTSF